MPAIQLVFRYIAANGILMALSEFPQVRDLPVREKLELVEEIWKDVARELDAMEVSPEEKRFWIPDGPRLPAPRIQR